ncbi:MAG TPA: homoserine kinase [Solirubrobacteraceae bacterium]|nr:homoserine kinase [Solirubrobacteraceae bacterium]
MSGVRIEVPGSSANLGAGYDVLAAALGLQLTVDVEETGRFRFVTNLHLRRDRQNLIVRAFERVLPADRYEFRVSSTIPLSGGMGSSAAGVVAGLLAADHFAGGGVEVLRLATEIEGHPDNVAASLLGGLVICDGAEVRRLDMPAELEAVLVIPHKAVRTSLAREAVPASVPIADAVHNVARAAKLLAGLVGSDFELIASGLGDRLHQPYRAHLYPRSAEIVAEAAAHGALGATISGAGPTVLVWCTKPEDPVLIQWLQQAGEGWAEVMVVAFEPRGARVIAF